MRTKKTTKSLPVITYDVRSLDDYAYFTSLPEIRKVVFDHMITAVKTGISDGKAKVSLFKIQDSDLIITLTRDKWKDTLINAIEFYRADESFEKCLDCQNLLSLL